MCVAKIFEGKMAQADIVLDTAQVSHERFRILAELALTIAIAVP